MLSVPRPSPTQHSIPLSGDIQTPLNRSGQLSATVKLPCLSRYCTVKPEISPPIRNLETCSEDESAANQNGSRLPGDPEPLSKYWRSSEGEEIHADIAGFCVWRAGKSGQP